MRFDGYGNHVYPVGLFRDVQAARLFGWRRLRGGLRYLRRQVKAREWRAVRNYFNGYLSEHGDCFHNAGWGWTEHSAMRRAWRIHTEAKKP